MQNAADEEIAKTIEKDEGRGASYVKIRYSTADSQALDFRLSHPRPHCRPEP